jgi:hypothetical protein
VEEGRNTRNQKGSLSMVKKLPSLRFSSDASVFDSHCVDDVSIAADQGVPGRNIIIVIKIQWRVNSTIRSAREGSTTRGSC